MEGGILVAALLGALCLAVALYMSDLGNWIGIKVSKIKIARLEREIAIEGHKNAILSTIDNVKRDLDFAEQAIAERGAEINRLRVDLISATDLALQSDARVKSLTGSVEMLEADNERKETALSTIAKASSSKNGTARRLARIARTALAA